MSRARRQSGAMEKVSSGMRFSRVGILASGLKGACLDGPGFGWLESAVL